MSDLPPSDRRPPTERDRESIPDPAAELGLAGIEFVEYVTDRPQALGQTLETMGFHAVARHRSREVILYRQGSMNLVVDAHPEAVRAVGADEAGPRIGAVAFRVRDAGAALARSLELGAWEVESRARAMELHIPAIHGPGTSRFHFVDRWREFSIYDIDFVPIPGAERRPPALAGMSWFGLVQYVDDAREADWLAWYAHLFGFERIADDERFGILPEGTLMRSAAGGFLWQLVAPIPWQKSSGSVEGLRRVGIGVPDVPAAVAALGARGVEFVDSGRLHPDDRGALTVAALGGLAFELVHRDGGPDAASGDAAGDGAGAAT